VNSNNPQDGKPSTNKNSDNALAGHGAPALMSAKEPAIRLLAERYSEIFALTPGIDRKNTHLFLIRVGLWALVWTFLPRENNDPNKSQIRAALDDLEKALQGNKAELLGRLDSAVAKAKKRIETKTRDFG